MTNRDRFLDFCQKQLSKPYILGSTGPATFDCSGLFYCALTTLFTEQIPRISTDQFALGVEVELAQILPGDLLFFDTGWTDRVPNHNGVCIGNGKMINANSHGGKVIEEAFMTGYWSSRIIGVRRIFDAHGKLDLFGKHSQVASFTDVLPTHTQYAEIEALRKQGVVRGFADGTFHPDQTVTRAEALKIILLCFEIPLLDADASLFSDVSDKDWHVTYITTAKKRGFTNGYVDGTFRPSNEINRAEIAKLLFEIGNVNAPQGISDIPDVPSDAWYCQYALASRKRKMFHFVGKKFLPTKSVTRGEMCQAIVRFREYKNG